MEIQGIITGIGNEITPEIDAVINEYIVGKNTILKGLELNGNILSAGTCILCGYRGTLENSQTVDGNYVYGKFVIGVNETDSFSIITSSNFTEPTDGIINPTSITSAGTYYLRLYANGASQVDSERYPKQAYISDMARRLIANGTIDSTATTDTAPVNDNSRRVATTEYVHNQIVAELDVATSDKMTYTSHTFTLSIEIYRKARMCIATVSISGFIYSTDEHINLGDMPQGFVPKEDVLYNFWVISSTAYIATISFTSSGNILLDVDTNLTSDGRILNTTNKIGYECQ